MYIRMISVCMGLAALPIAGCQHNEITIDKAMQQVGLGLYEMDQSAHYGPAATMSSGTTQLSAVDNVPTKPFGLAVDQVTITFNVQMSKTQANTLVLDANVAPPAVPGLTAGGTVSSSTTQQSSRSNTITVTLLNPIYAPSGTLIYAVATQPASNSSAPGQELDALLDSVQKHIHMLLKKPGSATGQ